ncbi:class I SAM-dependent methyltransferase [Acaryochloris sp. 'Moss Beach']|uniref:class I SAM-dependent methyltransferase n=1 Tax=Acaryochloris sp. 'Moss Beach' TaxID=2740837 RepID=UPI001F16A427|nr:class I SAM-dependent methyltransferase [Acaryochloris sp. 'Moss Beach']UJB71067.1 class I SAM-dependent methyltransferase [Acaryochloris sp. 'Moss Beach']
MNIPNIPNYVKGWLTDTEAQFLYTRAKACPPETVIVEIGSWKGKSTICLSQGSAAGENVPIYAVDPHQEDSYQEFEHNVSSAGVRELVTPMVKTSAEACEGWTQPIGLLFIDGNHEHDMVEQDYLLWSPFVVEGGTIAFHDSTSSPFNQLMGYLGPKRVVDKYLFQSKAFKNIGFTGTTTYATKELAQTVADTLARWSTRGQKLLPDSLMLIHHHVLLKLPSGVLKGIRRLMGYQKLTLGR